MSQFKSVRIPEMWRESNDWQLDISPHVLELVDMGKIGRRLKSAIQLEYPAVGDCLTKEAFEIFRGWSVGFDLVSLPVELLTSVVVGRDVDMKDETILLQVAVPFLGDVRAEVGVAAIGWFDGVSSQNAGYQRISIRLAICNQMDNLAGSAASVGRFVQCRGGRRHKCRCGSRRGSW